MPRPAPVTRATSPASVAAIALRRPAVAVASMPSHLAIDAASDRMRHDEVPHERLQALGLRASRAWDRRWAAARRRRRAGASRHRRGRRHRRRWRRPPWPAARASTRLTLTGGSIEPPPTENTNRQSPARKRDARSQFAYAVSQPSSLIRAVSSETLSETQYASKPASLRKSHVACEAWPAPPPEPQKNSRPPRSRVRDQHVDDAARGRWGRCARGSSIDVGEEVFAEGASWDAPVGWGGERSSRVVSVGRSTTRGTLIGPGRGPAGASRWPRR